ncbi:MAG: 4-alpha-glucanotransferase [Clostridiales bacterium]|nr:4-alpha-glucanotransferase [Clostridiales bacterium]
MRESGVLLHITSLPEPGGIGTLGQAAYDFADFLHQAGMTIWQVLPVGPTGYGESPYQSASTFAGNPLLIDMKLLEKEGLLPDGAFLPLPDSDHVDFDAVRAQKEGLLRQAFANADSKDMEKFIKQHPWAEDYGLFMALKGHFGGASWMEWPQEIRVRKKGVMAKWREKLNEEIHYHIFVQHLFYKQWNALKKYANKKGIQLFGDMPIYVAEDSADAWTNPDIFQFDKDCRPIKVAGVPPDYFSEDGQLWGNPLYNWATLSRRKYSWWIDRLNAMGNLFDLLRVDHFIGFANYYSIPAGAKNAKGGEWIKSPGESFFKVVQEEVKGVRIIAEDLGEVNDRVKKLLRFCGYPGMKVLTFGFDGDETNPHFPDNYTENYVAYTGTHDNDTVLGWWEKASDRVKEFAMETLEFTEEDDIALCFIEEVLSSPAERAIIPMQDFLRLGSEGRMNTPGTVGHNWGWRMASPPSDALKKEMKALNQFHQRGKNK